MAKKKQGGKMITLFGVLTGAVVGAAVALTYTPGSGDENRQRLASWTQNRANDAGTWAQHRAGDAGTWTQHRATDATTWAQHRATDASTWAQHRADEAGTWAQHRAEDAKAKVESVLPGGEQPQGPDETAASTSAV